MSFLRLVLVWYALISTFAALPFSNTKSIYPEKSVV